MDLWCGGWYASVENMRNGGDYNARTVEDIVAAASGGVGYCHWDMPFLLHLFGNSAGHVAEYAFHTLCHGIKYSIVFIDY